jgi:hypothetical protein
LAEGWAPQIAELIEALWNRSSCKSRRIDATVRNLHLMGRDFCFRTSGSVAFVAAEQRADFCKLGSVNQGSLEGSQTGDFRLGEAQFQPLA